MIRCFIQLGGLHNEVLFIIARRAELVVYGEAGQAPRPAATLQRNQPAPYERHIEIACHTRLPPGGALKTAW